MNSHAQYFQKGKKRGRSQNLCFAYIINFVKQRRLFLNRIAKEDKSSNIGKTTTTKQCKRVPDLWRPGSVKIKRYYAKNGRLISGVKGGKEIKQ